MGDSGGLADFSLMELFRSEVETHSEVLSAALLALERSPGETSHLQEMMRAAHSIKGAARVVGVDAAVRVAHAMEDCFVAAQKGTLTLSPGHVDTLLRGVDLLGKISEATTDSDADLANIFNAAVKSLVVELEAMLVPGGKAGGGPAKVAVSSVPIAPVTQSPGGKAGILAAEVPVVTAPGATTIAIPEMLDAAAAEEIRLQFLSALQRGYDPIRIDLLATKDLDVQGLALLAAIPRHIARPGGPRLQLAGVSAEMETVLGVTGLDGSYNVRPGSTREGA
jgi:two-component system sensor histidine kinase and response regulator WspE